MQRLLDSLRGEAGTFGIVNAAIGATQIGDSWDGAPSYRTQFADQALDATATFAGCTAAFTTGFAVRSVRAYIWMKNYKLGQATLAYGPNLGMVFQLQVATSASAFSGAQASSGTSVIAVYQAARATSCFYMNGVTPDLQNYAAARIVVQPTPNVLTDTASFDCNIDAT